MLVDLDELPKEFLTVDQTPGDKLAEDEKPEGEGDQGSSAEEPEEPPEIEEKSLLDLDLLIEEELEPAAELYEAVTGD